MKMENKYYTPSVKDFYIGFEYEYKDGEKWIKSNDLSNDFLYEDNPLYGVQKLCESNDVRVKWLDKEDILDCGFRKGHEFDDDNRFILKAENVLDGLQIQYEGYSEINKAIWITIYLQYNSVDVFVKNKSEFKILLKQLGIISNSGT